MRQWATDGPLSFKVCHAGTSETKFDDSGGDVRELPAHMVEVWMYVSNTGSSEQTYFIDFQRLQDADGREFSPYIRHVDLSNNRVSLNPGLTTDKEFNCPIIRINHEPN